MERGFDLFGAPVPEGWGKRGRPAHLVTDEKRSLVKVLLALEWTEPRIAAALLCTDKTLRKHYSRELAVRDQARAHADAKIISGFWEQGQKGNVGALKQLFALFEKHDIKKLAQVVTRRGDKDEARGKKEMQRDAAGKVAGKFAPPSPPGLIN